MEGKQYGAPKIAEVIAIGDELTTGVWVAAHPDLANAPRIALCRSWFIDALSTEPELAP